MRELARTLLITMVIAGIAVLSLMQALFNKSRRHEPDTPHPAVTAKIAMVETAPIGFISHMLPPMASRLYFHFDGPVHSGSIRHSGGKSAWTVRRDYSQDCPCQFSG